MYVYVVFKVFKVYNMYNVYKVYVHVCRGVSGDHCHSGVIVFVSYHTVIPNHPPIHIHTHIPRPPDL